VDEEKWPQLEYDPGNHLYVLTEYSGDQTIFNNTGTMMETKDRQGRTISYLYNGDKLEKILYPEGAYMEFLYDGNGRLSSIKDSTGRETQVITDSNGHVTQVIYPDNSKREFAYNDRGLMTMNKSGNAVKTYTWHEEWPVLTKVTLPNGGERTIEPCALTYLMNDKENDPGSSMDFPYMGEDDGLDSSVTYEDGRQQTFKTGKGWKSTYLNGKLKEKTEWANKRKDHIPIKIESGIDVDGAEVTEITYTNDLQVKTVLGKITDAQWIKVANDSNAPYKKTENTATVTLKNLTFTYDENNHLVSAITGYDTNMTFTYDAKGNLLEQKNVYLNRITKYTYDTDNNLVSIEYPDGRKNEMAYDSDGLLLEVKNNDGTKTTVTRNSRGEIESITDEENRTVTIGRDIMGRVIKETSPSGREVSYGWGGSGCQSCSGSDLKLTKIIDSGNKQWEFKYDIMGNVTEMIYPNSSKLEQAYDVSGRLTTFTNKRLQQIQYEYDTDGRMIKKTTPEGVVNFTYDARDRLSGIEAPDFHYKYEYGLISGNYFTIMQEENLKTGLWSQYINDQYGLPKEYYDSFEWKKTYWYNFAQSGGTPIGFTPYLITYTKWWDYGEYRMHYTYDKGNRLTIRKNYYLNTQKNFSYDTNGVLSQLMYRGPTAFPDIDINFIRDDSGLITSITGDKELNVNYNPDLEIEGVQHILPQPFDESYTYDTRGNRLTSLTHSYTYNDLNQLTGSTTHSYSYDADGNLIEEKNKITTETKKYYYNSENRLIMYEHYPNDVSQTDIVANYKYDIFGRRLQKNVNGTVINFTWEGDNLALELDENLQPIRRYVYGVGKDDVEGYVELSEVTGGMFEQYKHGWYSYVKDQVGTIYKVYSDYSQQIVDTRTYDTSGNLKTRVGTSTSSLGFQSKYFDQESGLNYFFYRYYNPHNGIFINEDPIRLSGGLNVYLFAEQNSINWLDLFGLSGVSPEKCAEWREKIQKMMEKLKNEIDKYDPVEDGRGGHTMKWGRGRTNPGGHYEEITNLQRGLRIRIFKYKRLCNDDDPPVPPCDESLIDKEIPEPIIVPDPEGSEFCRKLLIGAWIILIWEGSRIWCPPRNLVPVF
jgi:RHS repeat-associated protein